MSEKDDQEAQAFLMQILDGLYIGTIHDFDTNFRMANRVLPNNLASYRKQDSGEISAQFRKIHLSDVVMAGLRIKSRTESSAPNIDLIDVIKLRRLIEKAVFQYTKRDYVPCERICQNMVSIITEAQEIILQLYLHLKESELKEKS